jgi:hypothetical protein
MVKRKSVSLLFCHTTYWHHTAVSHYILTPYGSTQLHTDTIQQYPITYWHHMAVPHYILTQYTMARSHPRSQQSPRAVLLLPHQVQTLTIHIPQLTPTTTLLFFPSVLAAMLHLLPSMCLHYSRGQKEYSWSEYIAYPNDSGCKFLCSINTYTKSPKCHCTKIIIMFQEHATLFTNQCFLRDETFRTIWTISAAPHWHILLADGCEQCFDSIWAESSQNNF